MIGLGRWGYPAGATDGIAAQYGTPEGFALLSCDASAMLAALLPGEVVLRAAPTLHSPLAAPGD